VLLDLTLDRALGPVLKALFDWGRTHTHFQR